MNLKSSTVSEKTLADLAAELAALQRDVTGLGDDLLNALEENWAVFQSSLFPMVEEWGREWGVAALHFYRLSSGQMHLIDALSVQPSPSSPQRFAVRQDAPLLDQALGLGWSPLLLRALAGRELEMGFETCQAAMPFSLFDSVVGVALVSFAPDKAPGAAEWPRLIVSVERLFERMRREVVAGRIAEIKRVSQNAG